MPQKISSTFVEKKKEIYFFFTCQRVRHIANFSVLLSQTETLSVSFEINLILVACTLFPSRQKNLRTPAHALTSSELLGYHSSFPYHKNITDDYCSMMKEYI